MNPVRHAPDAPPEALLRLACEAADAARPETFFRSAAWLSAIVETAGLDAGVRLVDVGESPTRPAWALLGRRRMIRHRVMPVRVVALNQTLDPLLDQPWIERNGFFGGAAERFGDDLDRLLLRLAADPGWDELWLPGVDDACLPPVHAAAARHRLGVRIDIEAPGYLVDLSKVRATTAGTFLASLSSNARQQLRSSHRRIERQYGPLQLTVAHDARQALAWLDAAAVLHLERWGRSVEHGVPTSGFANPSFVAFHRRLIEGGFPAGRIQLLRIAAADRAIAYLYNFVSGKRVEFYLSGVDYSIGEACRPGSVAHWLAIEHALSIGMDVYDFLAGEARYKRTLSNGATRTRWLALERPRWRLAAERFGRALKGRLRQRRQVTGGPPPPTAP